MVFISWLRAVIGMVLVLYVQPFTYSTLFTCMLYVLIILVGKYIKILSVGSRLHKR